jgi:hypothetical protein
MGKEMERILLPMFFIAGVTAVGWFMAKSYIAPHVKVGEGMSIVAEVGYVVVPLLIAISYAANATKKDDSDNVTPEP